MGDEEVEYKAEYLDTAEDAEPEVSNLRAGDVCRNGSTNSKGGVPAENPHAGRRHSSVDSARQLTHWRGLTSFVFASFRRWCASVRMRLLYVTMRHSSSQSCCV